MLATMLAGGVAAKPSHCRRDCQAAITSCLARVPSNGDCTGTRTEKKLCWRMHAEARKTCRRLTNASGNVYVADYGNNRIQKFDANGAFLGAWGSSSSGNGQFTGPTAVATDAGGNVYVADQSNDRIQKFACP